MSVMCGGVHTTYLHDFALFRLFDEAFGLQHGDWPRNLYASVLSRQSDDLDGRQMHCRYCNYKFYESNMLF